MDRGASVPFDHVSTDKDYAPVAGPNGSSGLIVHGIPLVRHPEIATPEEADSLITFAQQLHHHCLNKKDRALRISVMQLSLVENEWTDVLRQHSALIADQSKCPGTIAHISLPTEPLYGKPIAETVPDYLIKLFSKLLLQFNGEAWTAYCQWVGEEIAEVLATFKPEDSEEYQLQARLEDFLHEIRSTILRDLMLPLQQAVVDEYPLIVSGDEGALRKKEKIVIACRAKIRDLLDVQQELLLLISEGVAKIDSLHPELEPLKITVDLMRTLIAKETSWSARLLAAQLLDQQLGVVSVITGEKDSGRLHAIFSIRAALAELSSRYPLGQLAAMCCSWGEENRGIGLAEELRNLVIKHAKEQLSGWKDGRKLGQDASSLPINGDWISFIPEKFPVRSEEFHGEVGVLISDKDTGKIIGTTSEGARLLVRLGFIP